MVQKRAFSLWKPCGRLSLRPGDGVTMTHLHGPVPLDEKLYSERPFETELVRTVQAGRWVLMLGPRQHGKTSALLRLKKSLVDNGMHVASIDLQRLPPVASYSELVAWFANSIASEFGIRASIEPSNDLSEALSVAVPEGKAPVIILLDEASNIAEDDRRNAFYGQIRSLTTERGDVGPEHVARRLRFVFSGTFREERLVAEANSPFNTCERIDTSDLSLGNVEDLAQTAGLETAGEVAQSIFAEVSGQPYLVQRLLDVAQEGGSEALAPAIAELRSGRSEHIRHLFRRVLSDAACANIVSALLRDGRVPYEPGDDDQRYLVVLGLVKVEDNGLQFRNALYRHVASVSPQLAGQAVEGLDRIGSVLFTLPPASFSSLNDVRLREIAFSAQAGAVGANQNGSNRLALAGFGNALEAVLLDYLIRQGPGGIQTASAECKNTRSQFYNANDPSTWTLADMMRGARRLAGIAGPDIPESLREWRNLVHPSVCLQAYRPDETYAPEVFAAAGLSMIVLRDLV